MGIGSGDRVATTLPPGLEFVALMHALPRLGAALVPLDPQLGRSELGRRMELAGARTLVRSPLAQIDEGDVESLAQLDPDAIHTVLFTSGTGGEPKPVELTLRNHVASALASAWNLGVDPGDRWLCVLPLFHVGGLSILIRSALYGTTAVLPPRFEAAQVVAELTAGRVTLTSLVPTMLHRLRESGLEKAPALRAALLGGGPLPDELLGWAHERGLPILPTYGMTETASQIATASIDDPRGGMRGARALPGVEIEIAAAGEILVRGSMVAPGELAPDGWLHTGDLGTLDADGRLRVTGRIGDVIVTGGENVSPELVERALLMHPAVADAGVVGVPDREWGEAIFAYVVLIDDATEEELVSHCRERLARAAVPKRIEQVVGIPRSPAGKLLRHELVPP
jgi:O-succinylbenzoic acid--CoA ligase